MDKWKKGIEILKNYKILVIKRETDPMKEILMKFKEYQKNIIVADIKPRDLSSTKIRKLIKDGKKDSLKKYLDSDIITYIEKEHLYED